jgi:predicted MFS family arabinose efflux permease
LTSIWRNRDFTLLWSGRLVSTLGSGVSAIALPLLVLAITGSPAKAGLVSAASGAPYFLLAVPAGVVADRFNRRAILIACDAGRGITWAVVGAAVAADAISLPWLAVAAGFEGSLFVFHDVAMTACLPRVVTREQLPDGVAQNAVILGVSDLLGPAIGGAVFQIGRAVPFAIDAVSYLASIATVSSIRTPLDPERDPEQRRSVLSEAADGLRFLRRQPALRMLAIVGGIGDLLFSGIALVLIVVAQERADASALTIGVIFGVASAAGVLGALVGARLLRRLEAGAAFLVFGIAGALVFPFLAAAPNAVAIGVLWAVNVFVLEISNVARESYQLAIIPDQLQGRVNSVVDFISYGGLPVGTALAGFALAAFGAITTIALMAMGRVLLTGMLLASPSVRRARLEAGPGTSLP